MGYETEKVVPLDDLLANCWRIEARRGTNGTWRVVYQLKDIVSFEGQLLFVEGEVWVKAKKPRGDK